MRDFLSATQGCSSVEKRLHLFAGEMARLVVSLFAAQPVANRADLLVVSRLFVVKGRVQFSSQRASPGTCPRYMSLSNFLCAVYVFRTVVK